MNTDIDGRKVITAPVYNSPGKFAAYFADRKPGDPISYGATRAAALEQLRADETARQQEKQA